MKYWLELALIKIVFYLVMTVIETHMLWVITLYFKKNKYKKESILLLS